MGGSGYVEAPGVSPPSWGLVGCPYIVLDLFPILDQRHPVGVDVDLIFDPNLEMSLHSLLPIGKKKRAFVTPRATLAMLAMRSRFQKILPHIFLHFSSLHLLAHNKLRLQFCLFSFLFDLFPTDQTSPLFVAF